MKNIADSVKARLKNIANAKKMNFDFICLKYLQERLLYRLSVSKYKTNFVLKGGLILNFLKASEYRPTKDIDFLGIKVNNDPEQLKDIFKEICLVECEDGVLFDHDSIETSVIKEGMEYEGTRLKLIARLGSVRIIMTLDIGFGDIITDGAKISEYQTLLKMENPLIYIYPFETVIAEKFESIVKLNYQTSRMKDFYDIYFISRTYNFDLQKLAGSIQATFKKRGTSISDAQRVFTIEFKTEPKFEIQWKAFIRRGNLTLDLTFKDMMKNIELFLIPVINPPDRDLKWDHNKQIWE